MESTSFSRDRVNVGQDERLVSIIGGTVLLLYVLRRYSALKYLLTLVGGVVLLYRGITGRCPVYRALGISSRKESVEDGIHVEESITINRPPEELYRFWRELENLPRFMSFLERVTPIDDRRSHWVLKGPAGWQLEWDAVIVSDVENERISWRTLPGADIPHSGTVYFRGTPDGHNTEITLRLSYVAPGGTIGKEALKLIGEDPFAQVRANLLRLKEIMEVREEPLTEG